MRLIGVIGRFGSDHQDRCLSMGARRSSKEVMTRDDTNLLRLLFDLVPLWSASVRLCVLPVAARALTCLLSIYSLVGPRRVL